MRTTLDLDDELLNRARKRAQAEGRTLTSWVEDALAAALAPRPAKRSRFRLQLEVDQGGRYLGGVDLADRDALYAVLERDR